MTLRDLRQRATNFLDRHPLWRYIIIFCGLFVFFAFLQSGPYLSDPDAFYHIRISQQMASRGILTEFPNLPYTEFTRYFTDHHLLYHILLIPFVTLFDPVLGAKIAQALFATLSVLGVYMLLRKVRAPLSGLMVITLCVSAPFIFRVSLIKVPALSVIVLLAAIHLIIRRRLLFLFVLSFIYVWLYGGFLLIGILTGLFVFSAALIDAAKGGIAPGVLIKNVVGRIRDKHSLWLLTASFGGLLAGVVINPYFPRNVFFYWSQIIEIGLRNYQDIISVGSEWYPYALDQFFAVAYFEFIWLITAFILSIWRWRRISSSGLALFFFAIFLGIFTLKSRRYVEYFVPFSLVWAGVVLRDTFPDGLVYKDVWNSLRDLFTKFRHPAYLYSFFLVLAVPYLAYLNVRNARSGLLKYPAHMFDASGRYLRENTGPGDIVFNSNWGHFPLLYFHSPDNYYVIGLDPTFLYRSSADLYWSWSDIQSGKQTAGIYKDIKDKFKAKYVFVSKENVDFEKNIMKDPGFIRVYNDDEAAIFRVK